MAYSYLYYTAGKRADGGQFCPAKASCRAAMNSLKCKRTAAEKKCRITAKRSNFVPYCLIFKDHSFVVSRVHVQMQKNYKTTSRLGDGFIANIGMVN